MSVEAKYIGRNQYYKLAGLTVMMKALGERVEFPTQAKARRALSHELINLTTRVIA